MDLDCLGNRKNQGLNHSKEKASQDEPHDISSVNTHSHPVDLDTYYSESLRYMYKLTRQTDNETLARRSQQPASPPTSNAVLSLNNDNNTQEPQEPQEPQLVSRELYEDRPRVKFCQHPSLGIPIYYSCLKASYGYQRVWAVNPSGPPFGSSSKPKLADLAEEATIFYPPFDKLFQGRSVRNMTKSTQKALLQEIYLEQPILPKSKWYKARSSYKVIAPRSTTPTNDSNKAWSGQTIAQSGFRPAPKSLGGVVPSAALSRAVVPGGAHSDHNEPNITRNTSQHLTESLTRVNSGDVLSVSTRSESQNKTLTEPSTILSYPQLISEPLSRASLGVVLSNQTAASNHDQVDVAAMAIHPERRFTPPLRTTSEIIPQQPNYSTTTWWTTTANMASVTDGPDSEPLTAWEMIHNWEKGLFKFENFTPMAAQNMVYAYMHCHPQRPAPDVALILKTANHIVKTQCRKPRNVGYWGRYEISVENYPVGTRPKDSSDTMVKIGGSPDVIVPWDFALTFTALHTKTLGPPGTILASTVVGGSITEPPSVYQNSPSSQAVNMTAPSSNRLVLKHKAWAKSSTPPSLPTGNQGDNSDKDNNRTSSLNKRAYSAESARGSPTQPSTKRSRYSMVPSDTQEPCTKPMPATNTQFTSSTPHSTNEAITSEAASGILSLERSQYQSPYTVGKPEYNKHSSVFSRSEASSPGNRPDFPTTFGFAYSGQTNAPNAASNVSSGHHTSTKPSSRALLLTSLTTAIATLTLSFSYSHFSSQNTSNTHSFGSPIQYAKPHVMLEAIKEISKELGKDSVSYDEDEILRHSYSEWSSSNSEVRPLAIVYPKSTDEVSVIARICSKFDVPMGIDPHSILNSQFLDDFLTLHLPNSGTNAMRYGTMKDWVVNLTVVLADGTVIKTRRRPRKTSAGFNLTSLFIGAEGTLGLITEITLKLAVIPETTSVAIVTFPTLKDAATAASKIMRTGIPLAAMEIMDDVQMSVINKNGGTGGRLWEERPTLFFKFSGTAQAIQEHIQKVRSISTSHLGSSFQFARTEAERTLLWSARKQALWSILAIRPPGTEIWSTDVAVPFSRMAEIIELSKQESSRLGLFSTVLGHVGDGNFHQAVMYNPKDGEQTEAVAKCVHDMVDLALEMEGTSSDCLMKELGLDTITVMRRLKFALDPQ
ncbi:hypothetical protein B7494_g1931 [Chlorociboria aeruginascens]|nr:hypothetical protein B7494_g1931 [Chlorociboria aeruginascens]